MQRKNLYKIISIFLSVYLPLVTIGLPLHKHYCGGNLEDSQWLIGVESCHDKAENEDSATSCCSIESTCHSTSQNESEDNDCCEDEVEFYKTEISFVFQKTSERDFEELDIHFFTPIEFRPLLQIVKESFEPKKLKYFHPYPNGQSIIIRHQQFLC